MELMYNYCEIPSDMEIVSQLTIFGTNFLKSKPDFPEMNNILLILNTIFGKYAANCDNLLNYCIDCCVIRKTDLS